MEKKLAEVGDAFIQAMIMLFKAAEAAWLAILPRNARLLAVHWPTHPLAVLSLVIIGCVALVILQKFFKRFGLTVAHMAILPVSLIINTVPAVLYGHWMKRPWLSFLIAACAAAMGFYEARDDKPTSQIGHAFVFLLFGCLFSFIGYFLGAFVRHPDLGAIIGALMIFGCGKEEPKSQGGPPPGPFDSNIEYNPSVRSLNNKNRLL